MWLFRLLSRLPWSFYYRLSTLTFFLIYRVAGYRKGVVNDNLRKCFPDYQEKQITSIRIEFYQRFFDSFFETIKALTATEEQLKKRVKVEGGHLISDYLSQKTTLLLCGHIMPWELLGNRLDLLTDQFPTFYSYQKIKNELFDQLMAEIRGRFGAKGVLREETARAVIKSRDEHAFFLLISDQSPFGHRKRYWSDFLGRDTAFYYGVGQLAEMTKCPILMVRPKRTQRGRYTVEVIELVKIGENLNAAQILERYIKQLDKWIREDPAAWLWTHRRWKANWREGDIKNPIQ